MDIFKLLRDLTEIAGPSGNEANIANAISEWWKPLVDSMDKDRVGSLIAVKNGHGAEPRRCILLAAHMDELGLMVKKILSDTNDGNGNGFLRVTNVGGVDIRHLYGQIVVVHSTSGQDLVGVLGSLPGRMLPKPRRNKPYGYEELVVDVGMRFDELRGLVSVGDFISFRQPLRKLLNKRVTGKALDNRASVAVVTVCLDYLKERQHEWDVIAVATAQEETRLLGAFTSAFAEKPDAAVAIDVTFGSGPGATDELTYELNGGPTVGLGPNVHPGMNKALSDAAAALEMKVHTEPHGRASGTDAFGLQVAREGIPTGLVGIPLRYMHTMVETVAINDVKRAGRLLGEMITRLDGEFLEKIASELLGAGDTELKRS